MDLFKSKEECCGCMACVDACPKNAISVKRDSHGFDYPYIDRSRCVKCGKCKSTCALKKPLAFAEFDKKCFAVKSKNEEERKKSSSGGIYPVLSDYVLGVGGVVYGAAYTTADRVVHLRCENKKDRDRTRQTKYVQSNLCGVYKQIENDLQKGVKVLFSGTPCQVSAVKNMFPQYRKQLILIDIICHGVPSPGIFSEHIDYCSNKGKENVEEYIFRNKIGDGRNQHPGIRFADGRYDDKSKHIGFYPQMFLENKLMRESCFVCPYASEKRISDITIGDFWGIKNVFPDFDDGYGVSAVVINSPQGQKLFDTVKDKLFVEESTFEDISQRNPNLKKPSTKPKHMTFWIRYSLFGWNRIVNSYTRNGLIKRLKRFITK